ncbi:hypothetical protein [Coprobacter fastidiosus]|uniref:hypothetical protein n=1 Tax=Coprobacter fastidiosus TaxID=1099853 RepID=UPI000240EDAB|nr:hypothetical protein [Coprobacter fastidiosus]EHL81111.1 hypothetical protein HMPREF1033_02993 [Tannerella sp. 6_1_58FAA_CT1]
MGLVIDYIIQSSDGEVKAYDSQKRFIDEAENDTFGEFDDHINEVTIKDKSLLYAEDKPFKESQKKIDPDLIRKKHNKSLFKYFLDGTRQVYKVGDIAIDGVVYPLAVGQIIVGYCGREGRDIKIGKAIRKLVLAVPVQYDTKKQGQNFFRKKCEEINKKVQVSLFYQKFHMKFSDVISYGNITDKQIEMGRNKYLRLAISKIQNEMLDQERLLVEEMVLNGLVSNDDAMLIKDGSIEYKKDFTNRPDKELASAVFNQNFRDVVGVSKLFDPELLSRNEPHIGTIIAELKPMHRTKAYRYIHEGKSYCVWYIRLRNTINRSNSYSDIIKVEMFMVGNKIKQSALIDSISAHLINEAYPVCYGKDARWANHLYPVYVTETFCKSNFVDEKLIIKII